MNSELREFFKMERKRVFTPDPYFSDRVLRLAREQAAQDRGADYGIWDVVPTATRPVMALALMLLFALFTLEVFIPVEPSRGLIEAYLSSQQSEGETLLYATEEEPGMIDHEVLEQLIVLEGGQ